MFQSQFERAPTFAAAVPNCLDYNANINIECVLILAVSSVLMGGYHINVSGFEMVLIN